MRSSSTPVARCPPAPAAVWRSEEPPRRDHHAETAPAWLTATEFRDAEAALGAKVEVLAHLLRLSKVGRHGLSSSPLQRRVAAEDCDLHRGRHLRGGGARPGRALQRGPGWRPPGGAVLTSAAPHRVTVIRSWSAAAGSPQRGTRRPGPRSATRRWSASTAAASWRPGSSRTMTASPRRSEHDV